MWKPKNTENDSNVPSSENIDTTQSQSSQFSDFKREEFEYEVVEYRNLPQGRNSNKIKYSEDQLDNLPDIRRTSYRDQSGMHGVGTARYLLELLNDYHQSENESYRRKARAVAEEFVNRSIVHRDGIYLPYEFTYYQHGDDTFRSPWYSGMAQGICLSAYVRGYKETDSDWYRDRADDIFRSLRTFPTDRSTKPWVVAIENDEYYWIEEYPKPSLIHTLNGFNFAIWGLYEYWKLNQSQRAKRTLDVAITTVKHHLSEYRRPDKLSFYCLGHDNIASRAYHTLHIRQFRDLNQLTGDDYFNSMADRFRADMPPENTTSSSG